MSNSNSPLSTAEHTTPSPWDHTQTEREKEQGMKYAQSFGALDGLHDVFSGGEEEGVLGVYGDL